jgi:ketosteroid isomerase-like protein
MTRLALAAVLPALCLASCASPHTDTQKEIAKIMAEEAQISAAEAARNAEAAVAYDADDFVAYVAGKPPVIGKAADLANKRVLFVDPNYIDTYSDIKFEIASSGDLAIETAKLEVSQTDPKTGAIVHLSGNSLTTFRKDADGVWKVSRTAVTLAPAG